MKPEKQTSESFQGVELGEITSPHVPVNGYRKQSRTSAAVKVDKAGEKSKSHTHDFDHHKRQVFACQVILGIGLLLATIALCSIYLPLPKKPLPKKPPNDTCETATELELNALPIAGTLAHATGEWGGLRHYASGDEEDDPTVWYVFHSDSHYSSGAPLKVEVHLDGIIRYSVYEGTSCNDTVEYNTKTPFGMEEGMYSDEYTYTYEKNATLFTRPGLSYYIFVATCQCDHCAKDFAISVTSVNVAGND